AERLEAHAALQRPAGMPALRVPDGSRIETKATRLAHVAAGPRYREEYLAQEPHQGKNEGEHGRDEEQADELRQVDFDERVDESDRNQQADEKRAQDGEHDRGIDELHAPAEQVELLSRVLLPLGLELAQPVFERAAAVDRPAQANREHADDRPHRSEQEHRGDRELDEPRDVSDVVGVHSAPPQTMAFLSWCLKWWMWLRATLSLPRSFAASASSRFFCHSWIFALVAALSMPFTSWCTCMSMLSA